MYILKYHQLQSGPPTGGGQLGHFAPGPSLKGAPGSPMKGPLNTCLKDRYTLIEQSDLNTLIEHSQYSSEEQCSKLIEKEIWLVMGSYCHCQQVRKSLYISLVRSKLLYCSDYTSDYRTRLTQLGMLPLMYI